MAQTVRYKRI